MSTPTLPLTRLLACLLMVLLSVSMKGQGFTYPGPVCANGPVVFPTLPPGFPPGGTFSAPAGLNIQPGSGMINPPMSMPGTYNISYTGFPGGGVITTTVTVHDLTPISITNNTVCATSSVIPLVVAASPSTGLSYTWAPSAVTGPTVNVFPPYGNQTLTLFIIDGNGCQNMVSAPIIVTSGPSVFITGSSTVCPGSPVVLTANGVGATYLWSTGSTGNSINVSPAGTTAYFVTATDASGCSSVATKTVTVNSVNLSVNNATLCSGTSIVLTAQSVPSSGVSFAWYPGFLSGPSVNVSPASTQIYTVVANRSGCTSTAVAKVTVYPSLSPITSFSYQYPLCTDSPNQMPTLASGFSAGGIFLATGPAPLDIDDTTGLITFEGIAPGDYYITYNMPSAGCTVATVGMATLTVGQSGKLDLVPDVIVFKGSDVALTVSGGTSYNWTPAMYITCTNCDTPRVSPPESMRYCVSSDLCLDGGCVNVTVLCKNEGDLSVPNAFTPDGDGNNDQFCLQGWEECIREFEVLIFDRWGTKLYESDKASFCWDGSFNGQAMSAGVYTYVITARFDLAPHVVKKGTITLIR